jgi:hypothetical protein
MRLLRRPSPAMLVALTALVVAMSGTAVAATGGMFILGKANKATTVTSLSNSKGTALSLSSGAGKPPLTVGSTDEVPQLNASLLDGQPAAAFLGVNGTAYNSNELGGKLAADYVTGGGYVSHDAGILYGDAKHTLNLTIASNAFQVTFSCYGGTADGFDFFPNTGAEAWAIATTGEEAFEDNFGMTAGNTYGIVPENDPSTPTSWVVQVAFGSQLVTLYLSDSANGASPDSCNYAAQAISNG